MDPKTRTRWIVARQLGIMVNPDGPLGRRIMNRILGF